MRLSFPFAPAESPFRVEGFFCRGCADLREAFDAQAARDQRGVHELLLRVVRKLHWQVGLAHAFNPDSGK